MKHRVFAKGVLCAQPITTIVMQFWLTIPSPQHPNVRFNQAIKCAHSNIYVAVL